MNGKNEEIRFGLIGHPIEHSFSPKLFDAAYNGRYPYDLIQTDDFNEAFRRFIDGPYKAINVTAPFKALAAASADFSATEVKETGAANILVKEEDGIHAWNSDFLGVKRILSGINGIETVMVVGCGGAGQAAALAARSLGLDVVICNRSTGKAQGTRPLDDIPVLAAVCDIIIYTLPLIIPQMEGVSCPIIMEANYRDPQLKSSCGPDCRYISGTEWLLAQAVTGYELMSGIIPDIEALENVL